MEAFHPRSLVTSAGVVVAVAIVLIDAPLAAAQERQRPVGEFAAGALLFPDEGVVTEGFVGGTVRFYVLPRLSVGPEIAYIQGRNHDHLMLTGNLTFDFVAPMNGQPQAVTPFVVAGGGLFQTRETFFNDFRSREGAFTAGGGVRILVGRRVIAGAEARIGWESHVRLNGMIGFRLGG
jgi:hypothetical protein